MFLYSASPQPLICVLKWLEGSVRGRTGVASGGLIHCENYPEFGFSTAEQFSEDRRMNKKPRVVVVGAGMAGLSAANRLMKVGRAEDGTTFFDLLVLEASDRPGGRIYTTEFFGERVETGATWIHGIQGSPIYDIAKGIGALDAKGEPWECMDGLPDGAVVKAEGGLTVAPCIAEPIADLHRDLVDRVQNQAQGRKNDLVLSPAGEENGSRGRSLGAYLRDGLEEYLCGEDNKGQFQVNVSDGDGLPRRSGLVSKPGWDLRSLQAGIFSSQGHLERTVTAADSLYDVDLESNKEYWEFPGEHVTIPGGYSSVVEELVNRLPPGTIMYNKKVEGIVWCCSDGNNNGRPVFLKGPDMEADHVILTVSLGVLKSGIRSGHDERHTGFFRPGLPLTKIRAIERLGFGVVDKLLLHTDKLSQCPNIKFVFCDRCDDGNGVPWWMRKTFSLQPIHEKSDVAVAWFAGKEAMKMESLSECEVIKGVLDTLSAFDASKNGSDSDELQCYEKRLAIDGVLRSRWAMNPLFQGSYSYVPVGSTGEDIDTLAEPLPCPDDSGYHDIPLLQILFAGEATDRHYYSTTHGAYLSGLREANRLLKFYSFSLT